MPRKLPSRTTVGRWVNDFPELQFDGIKLRCTTCDTALSWRMKSHVLEHLASDKHKTRSSGDLSDRDRQKQFNLDLAKVMVECKIPWTKLDNPQFRQFLQNCVNGKYNNVAVPAESTLRKNYLSLVCDEVKTEESEPVETELHKHFLDDILQK